MSAAGAEPGARPALATVRVGDELPTRTLRVTRGDLVRYAGASGDDNVIHWSRRHARSVGLPDVIAHGMYTMALAGRAVSDWAGDPGAVAEFRVRFSKPVVVPDDDEGAEVTVTGRVDAVKEDERVAVVVLEARSAGEKVLAGARAVVRLV